MERYLLKRKLEPLFSQRKNDDNAKKSNVDIYLTNLPIDHGKRIPISSHDANVQDKVRRHYLQNGPCQPKAHKFPVTILGKSLDFLILVGLRNMIVGWSRANQKMPPFAFVVIFLHQTLENKEGVIVLWAKGIQIGKRMKDLTFMLEALMVLITKHGISVKT